MAGIAEKVFSLIKDTVEEQGVSLWDVRFVKEGASYYLRVFIDKQEGISIDDCTNVSHAIDPVIDAADPIDKSYYLEVCSTGLERELTRPEHFAAMVGRDIKLRLFKAYENSKELCGKLVSYEDGALTLETEKETIVFAKGDFAKANLMDL